MTPGQLRVARDLVDRVIGRTVVERDMLQYSEIKDRLTTTFQQIMLNPEYSAEFIAGVAAVALMMLVEERAK